MRTLFYVLSLAVSSPLWSSLSLYNDSVFPLTVKIIGANGAPIGQALVMPSGGHIYMEDQIGTSDPVGQGSNKIPFQNYANSLTPYQVFWYCLEGGLYSTCLDASAGATVTANTCQGTYDCYSP